MKLFQCQSCGNIVYFENRTCGRCGRRLAYLPETGTLSALQPAGNDTWSPLAAPERPSFFCTNAAHDACNWLVPPGSTDAFCLACRHNGTVPDLTEEKNLTRWRDMELAKHRLFYALKRWNLPLTTRAEDPEHGLVFNFLAEPPAGAGRR